MIGKNNIFNIRAGQKWVGSVGATRGFVDFLSDIYAVRSFLVLMRTYRHKYFLRSLGQIIARFAPPSENDTSAYVAFVAGSMGVPSNYLLCRDSDYYLLCVACARFETGTRISLSKVQGVAESFNILIC